MLKRTLLPLAALCCVFAVSCGPSLRHVQARSITEAEYLKAEVEAKNLQGDDVTAADGYFNKAKTTGSHKESANNADLAVAYYKIALARNALEISASALGSAETALKNGEEQVSKYRDVLARIETKAEVE